MLLIQAFAKAQEHRVPLAPTLSRTLKAQAPLLTSEAVRRSPEAAAAVLPYPVATACGSYPA